MLQDGGADGLLAEPYQTSRDLEEPSSVRIDFGTATSAAKESPNILESLQQCRSDADFRENQPTRKGSRLQLLPAPAGSSVWHAVPEVGMALC